MIHLIEITKFLIKKKNTVCRRTRINDRVESRVFINPKSVQRRGINHRYRSTVYYYNNWSALFSEVRVVTRNVRARLGR